MRSGSVSQVSRPVNWVHTNREGPDDELPLNVVQNVREEGQCIKGGYKELYRAHLKGRDYKYYDKGKDCKLGWPFLNYVTPADKRKWWMEFKEEQAQEPEDGTNDPCYLIYHGPGMGLYKKCSVFERIRDEVHTAGTGYSDKARAFQTLEDAKAFCQAIRDGEGAHWDWTPEVTIYWGSDFDENFSRDHQN